MEIGLHSNHSTGNKKGNHFLIAFFVAPRGIEPLSKV